MESRGGAGPRRSFTALVASSRRAVAVLVVCLVATALAVWQAHKSIDLYAERELAFACEEIRVRILDRLADHELILRGGSGVFDASEEVSRTEWRRFVTSLRLEREYPGIQGVGFSRLIPRDELAAHLQQVRAEGFPEYRVRPDGDRPVYSSIVYLEPFSGRNLRAFGYDMYSEPVRRRAMEWARDRNVAALSGKVVLVQETDRDVQAGTLMYVPVYRHDARVESPAERRAALVGWVYSPYRMNDLMGGILGGWDLVGEKRIRLRVFDGDTTSPEALLFDSQPALAAPAGDDRGRHREARLEFGGRTWLLQFSQVVATPAAAGTGRLWTTLVAGLLVSLLAFALTRSIAETGQRARALAERLAEKLAENERRLGLLVSNAKDLIYRYELLPQRRFVYVSPAALEITGYSPEEHYADPDLGSKMVHPDDRPLLQALLDRQVAPREPLTLRWIRKDGGVIWTEQQNTLVLDESGRLVAIEGVARDVTLRMQMEDALRRSEEIVRHLNADLEGRVQERTAELEAAAAELRQSEGEVRRLNADLEQRVAQRTVELEAANGDLASFAYSVSHDLKAPLRAIDGFTGLLLEGAAERFAAEDRRHLDLTRAAVRRMAALIDDLLDLARTTRSELRTVPMDLADLARSIAGELRLEDAGARGVEWVIPPTLGVEADPGLMRVVLENLLRNAWKFTSHRTAARIELGELPSPEERVFFVRDDGVGFDPAFVDRLFHPFQRLHRADEFPGTGLGLATVASVVRRHGGRTWAEGAPGLGATVYFSLPGSSAG